MTRWAKLRGTRLSMAVGLSLLAFTLSSCGKPQGGASGTVTWKDKPVTGGVVVFVPQEGGGGGTASIDPTTGKYEMPKLPVGTMKVAVQPAGDPPGAGGRPTGPGASGRPSGPPKDAMGPPKDVKLPEGVDPQAFDRNAGPSKYVPIDQKYQNPDSSGIIVTVEKGKTITFNIKLPMGGGK